jgi:hypothetical protein
MKMKKIIISLLFLSIWSAGLESAISTKKSSQFDYSNFTDLDIEQVKKTTDDIFNDRKARFDIFLGIAAAASLSYYLYTRYHTKDDKDKDNKKDEDKKNNKDAENKQDIVS